MIDTVSIRNKALFIWSKSDSEWVERSGPRLQQIPYNHDRSSAGHFLGFLQPVLKQANRVTEYYTCPSCTVRKWVSGSAHRHLLKIDCHAIYRGIKAAAKWTYQMRGYYCDVSGRVAPRQLVFFWIALDTRCAYHFQLLGSIERRITHEHVCHLSVE